MGRVLPAILVGAAIAAAAAAPSLRPRTVVPASTELIGCNVGALAGTDSVYDIQMLTGVRQPFEASVPFVSCSLAVDYVYYRSALLQIRAWDPLTLAPDPSMVALRSRNYPLSEMNYNHVRADFPAPLVVQPVPGVAEPTPSSLVLDFQQTYAGFAYGSLNLHYWTNGPSSMPPAQVYTSSGSGPMNGPHPVLGVSFCPADGQEDLRVLQAVSRSTYLYGTQACDFLQRFRVPERCRLEWIELAFGTMDWVYPGANGRMAILDSRDMPTPVAQLPYPDFSADFFDYDRACPSWASHWLTAAPLVLQPDHDYWLLAHVANRYPVYARDLSALDYPDFLPGVGALYMRTAADSAWQIQPARALNFRLIGEPEPAQLAVAPTVGPAGLRLAAGPNPAKGAALLRWSGARGAVRLEVLDARGAHVAAHDAAGEQGSWLWRGVGDAGTPAAAGVYFLRATDGEGTVGLARVTLVR